MMKIENTSELMELVNGFRLSRIVLTAHELKIFDHLAGKSCSSADLASLINTDKRATDRLMNVLAGMGLLEKQHGLFTNSAFAEKHLVCSSPAFLGGLGHTADLWRKWDTLTQVIKKGSAVDLEDNFNERGAEWLESFIAAMHNRGVAQGKELASLLRLSGVKRTLDVGGGSGAFTFAFIEKNPAIQSIIFDLPNVIPITQKYIDRYKLSSNVSVAAGDYHTDPFGDGFDLVLMSAIIHINDPEENRLLIRKGADAINPGGQLVIMDHLMNEDRTEPFQGAVFAINMLVGTKRGDTYTMDEITGWMKEAGLIGTTILTAPSGTQYCCGFKP
ncbi:MAG: methyltransferase [Bacteroidetes bacterium]|nr:methyltransferase [Bacteroidota bacterium]